LFLSNSEIQDKNTRFNHNFHLPSTNLTLVRKEVLYSGSKIYNHLPLNIKMLAKDAKQIKSTLRSYLIEHKFYSLDEYYQLTFMVLTQYIINLIIFYYLIYFMYQYKLVTYIMTNVLHTFMYIM
jgi:hypothetical protein